jgi:hypothetical protein
LVTIIAALLSTAAMPKAASAQEPETERVRVRLPGGLRLELPASVRVRTRELPAVTDEPPAPADSPAVVDETGAISADRLPEIEPVGLPVPPPLPVPSPPPPPPGPPPPPMPPSANLRVARSYGALNVVGSGASEFFYVRQDIWFDLADRSPTPLNRVRQGGNYGPHPIGGTVPVTVGANYLVFPACAGNIAWATRRLAMVPQGQAKGRTNISCRP